MRTQAIVHRPDIDGLRAIAVLSVVLFHVAPAALPGGFLGVDLFFVISGYLITLILLREQADGTFRFAAFYARRVRRLFPALIVVLLATLAFGAVALFADEYELLARHASYAIVFLLDFRLMGESGYFDVTSGAKPLLHLWSLSVEEQFYLVWPVLLVAARRLRMRIGAVIAVLGLASLAFSVYLGQHSPDALYFHPLARAWQLLVGAALACWHDRRGVNALPRALASVASRNLLSIAGTLCIAAALLGFDGRAPHPGPAALLPLAGLAAIIAGGGATAVNRALATKPLVLVGSISYPLYLWHWPLLSYVHIAESGSPPAWLPPAAAVLAILLAWVTYAFIEQPIRRGRGGRMAFRALIASMFGLLLMSRVVVAADGLPDRAAVRHARDAEPQMRREPRQDEACLHLFPPDRAPVYCRQANAGERMIGIIGDSHAHVLFPGVAELAASRGYGTLLLANSGCPPLDGAVTGRNPAERDECARSIERILRAVENDPRLAAVVIASRGPQYLDGTGFGPAEVHYNFPPIAARQESRVSTGVSPQQAFITGLRNTAGRLHARGIGVAYFLQVPELGVPARDCLVRPLVFSDRRRGCSVPYGQYRERMSEYRHLVDRFRRDDGRIGVIDPERALCTEHHCSGLGSDGLLYADDNHLSVAGSRRVAPLVIEGLGL